MRRKPRKCNYVKAIPKIIFENENGGIEIRRSSIKITGSVEGAARAMAEGILKRGVHHCDHTTWNYMDVIDVIYCSHCTDKYTLNLTGYGLSLIDLDQWTTFKKDVEKICNSLKAFL